MKPVENLCKQIVKKSKDKDAKYFYGVEYAKDRNHPVYKAYITFSKAKVKPVGIMVKTEKALIKGLKEYLDTGEEVIIKYHKAEIEEAEKSVFWHKEKIKEYEGTSSKLSAE